MLSISGTLATAQAASSQSPYVKAIITTSEGVFTETFESNSGANPLIYMREYHQVWAGELELLLWNGDQGLVAKNYTGRRVNPHWGYTASGDESAEHQPYWVVDQEFISFSGTSYLKLTCWSVWDLMGVIAIGGTAADAAPLFNQSFDKPIATVVDEILGELALKGFAAGIDLTVPGAALDENAFYTAGGIFKEYRPQVTTEWGTSVRQIIRLIMDFTLCGLRMRAAAMHVLFPAAGDSIDQTYQSGGYEILANNLHSSITVPNRIIYADKVPDTLSKNNIHEGEANDTDSQNRIGIVTQLFAPQAGTDIGNNVSGGNKPITGNNEAQQRADTILTSLQHESSTGLFTTRPNVALEVWDKVSVIDAISGVTTGGRVGGIESIWDATGLATPRTRYIQNVEIGGLTIRTSNLSAYLNGSIDTQPTTDDPAITTTPPPVIPPPAVDPSVTAANIANLNRQIASINENITGPGANRAQSRILETSNREDIIPPRPAQDIFGNPPIPGPLPRPRAAQPTDIVPDPPPIGLMSVFGFSLFRRRGISPVDPRTGMPFKTGRDR